MSLKVQHQQLITTSYSYILKNRKLINSSFINLLKIVKLKKTHHYNLYPFFLILLPEAPLPPHIHTLAMTKKT